MKANYHSHTYRCHHASGTEREYIETAIRNGLEKIGFSDHAPMPFKDGYVSPVRMSCAETEGYVGTLRFLRDEYAGRISVYIGYEAEYMPSLFDEFLDHIGQYGYDYLILGQHFLLNENGGENSFVPSPEERKLALYVDQVLTGLSTGKYTYLAHPDCFAFTGEEKIYTRYMELLCRECKRMNVPLELNLLGLRTSRHYPSERFYRIAAETGNEIIMGCDAHEARHEADEHSLSLGEAFAARYGLNIIDDVTLC